MKRFFRVVECIDTLVDANAYDLEKVCKALKYLNEDETIERLLIFNELCHGCIIITPSQKYVVLRDVQQCTSPIEVAQYFKHIINPKEYSFMGYGTGLMIIRILKK